jgi:hypothetical protein
MSFEESLNFGLLGENIVRTYLSNLSKVRYVVDVSNETLFQPGGIDFLLQCDGDKVTPVEVKTDRRFAQTRNLFLETVSNEEKQSEGWFIYSKAERLLYLSYVDHTLLDLNMPETREFVLDNKSRFRDVQASTRGNSGDVLYHTRGLLVPETEIYTNCRDWFKIDVKNFYPKG